MKKKKRETVTEKEKQTNCIPTTFTGVPYMNSRVCAYACVS